MDDFGVGLNTRHAPVIQHDPFHANAALNGCTQLPRTLGQPPHRADGIRTSGVRLNRGETDVIDGAMRHQLLEFFRANDLRVHAD